MDLIAKVMPKTKKLDFRKLKISCNFQTVIASM